MACHILYLVWVAKKKNIKGLIYPQNSLRLEDSQQEHWNEAYYIYKKKCYYFSLSIDIWEYIVYHGRSGVTYAVIIAQISISTIGRLNRDFDLETFSTPTNGTP